MAYIIDGTFISDSEIYDVVKREEFRRNKEKLTKEKERQKNI